MNTNKIKIERIILDLQEFLNEVALSFDEEKKLKEAIKLLESVDVYY